MSFGCDFFLWDARAGFDFFSKDIDGWRCIPKRIGSSNQWLNKEFGFRQAASPITPYRVTPVFFFIG